MVNENCPTIPIEIKLQLNALAALFCVNNNNKTGSSLFPDNRKEEIQTENERYIQPD